MIELFLAFFLSLFQGHQNAPAATHNNGIYVTTMGDADGGGEGGHLPNQPPPPPPPPPPTLP